MKSILAVALLMVAIPSFAEQSLSVSAGPVTRNANNEGSTGWRVEYAADPFLIVPFGMSLAYVNEGKISGHKRDEVVAKLVMYVPLFERFRIAAEAGPLRYNDTTSSGIQRGWGVMYGTFASYRLAGNWNAVVSWNRAEISGDGESDLFLLGLKFAWR